MELVTCAEDAVRVVAPDLAADRLRILDAAWPPSDPGSGADPDRHRHDPALSPVSALLAERVPGGRRLVACLDVLSKDVEVGGRGLAASGLSAVVTDPDRRGQGHGLRLVRAVRDLLLSGVRPFGPRDLLVFSCAPGLVPFYAAAGFDPLPGAVLVGGTADDELPSDRLGLVVMASCGSRAAAGSVLAQPPAGVRVLLHAGTRDRLW